MLPMSAPQAPHPTPSVVPPATAVALPVAAGETRQWTSAAILGNGREALIEHVGAVYRLRLTSSGKLILTK